MPIVVEASRNIDWLTVSEDGRELVYGAMVDTSSQHVVPLYLPGRYEPAAGDWPYFYDIANWGSTAPSSCVQVFRSLVTPGDSLVRNTPTACRAYQQSVAGFSVQIAERERPPNAGRRATRR